MIELRSDNTAGAADEILAAILEANDGSALGYGADPWTDALNMKVREVFEHPGAQAFPIVTGTAANALALSALCPPWGSVVCHESAHILHHEAGATSMFAGGAVMTPLPGEGYQIDPAALRAHFADLWWGDPHVSQPSVLSLTCPSDFGTLYSLDAMAELIGIAQERRLRVHLDGARIANALAALRASPADLTWRAGVDVVSLGATKNGALSADAIVSFDPAVSAELAFRLKRAGHTPSKMRFQSAQLLRYLSGGLWLDLAGRANAAMARLAAGLRVLDVELVAEPQVNIAFVRVASAVADRMEAGGLAFYRMGSLVRLVTSFRTTDDDVDRALAVIKGSL